jgi:hypothetical protein
VGRLDLNNPPTPLVVLDNDLYHLPSDRLLEKQEVCVTSEGFSQEGCACLRPPNR